MNGPTNSPDRDAEVAQIARDHPGWEIWKGSSGTYYARLHGDRSVTVHAQSPDHLGTEIRRAAIRQDNL